MYKCSLREVLCSIPLALSTMRYHGCISKVVTYIENIWLVPITYPFRHRRKPWPAHYPPAILPRVLSRDPGDGLIRICPPVHPTRASTRPIVPVYPSLASTTPIVPPQADPTRASTRPIVPVYPSLASTTPIVPPQADPTRASTR